MFASTFKAIFFTKRLKHNKVYVERQRTVSLHESAMARCELSLFCPQLEQVSHSFKNTGQLSMDSLNFLFIFLCVDSMTFFVTCLARFFPTGT